MEEGYVERFKVFFEKYCKEELKELFASYPKKRSLLLDFSKLERFDYELADLLLDNPDEILESAKLALEELASNTLELSSELHVRITNLPEENTFLLRDLGSAQLNKLVCVEGVIKQITDVLPKIKVAAWQCNRCGNMYKLRQNTHKFVQPVACECGSKDFRLIEEASEFVDYQKMQIQEPLEVLKGSEQPTTLDVYVADDLVNKALPGDTVTLVGILRLAPAKKQKLVFGRYLECIYLEQKQREFEEITISEEDIKKIKQLAKDPNIYQKLINSIAPNIYGHEDVKEAIVLQLFGGVKKKLATQQIRGNIHILLVGDPGVAKSQLLMAANAIAPKSIYVGGKTTTGVGLTASAVRDEFGEGTWTLKAGALVLASGGIAMVDELDKMPSDERVALHEAMEQGTVSVAKAGIITRFRADTSILAAANPKFSRFEPYENLVEQINLPPTLISRFDLFFLIRDILDKTQDTEIANFILESHKAGEKLAHSKASGKKLKEDEKREIKRFVEPEIDPELLRKYISYARQNVFPVLSEEAKKTLVDFYVSLREKGRQEGTYAATHRQLEGLIRLSEASARVRLSNVVEKEDAERAIRLLKRSLKDVITDPETGKIDMDIILTGQTHTQIENMRKVLSIIRNRAKEVESVPLNEVLDEAEALGIPREKAEDIINKLEKKGEIYRPRHGFLRPTQRD